MQKLIFISRLLKKTAIIILLFSSIIIKAQIQLTLPTITGTPGNEVIVDFTVNDLTSYRVQGYQFKISFDPAVIRFSDPGNNQAGTISSGASTQISSDTNYIKTGRINVVSIKGSDYTGAGKLFSLKVKFLTVGTSSITLAANDQNFTNKIFNYNLQDVSFTVTNGSATSTLIQQYTVTTSSNPTAGGIVTQSGTGTYNSGSSVTVTATANSGYSFVNWTEGSTVVSTSAGYNFTISANRTLVANFVQQYTVTTSSNPTAGGTVTQSGTGTYNSGSSVTVTATPATGYTFTGWGGDATGSTNPLIVTMNSNKNIIANFAISTYTLTVNAANGTVTKNPDQANYNHGTTVQLTATPATGYTFTGWSGDATGSTNPLTVTMNSNKNITANFAINTFTVTLSAAPAAGGIVTQSGTGTYSPGSSVTVTASANSGYNFVSWTESGTVVSTGLSYSFIINSNRALVANFTQAQYTVTLSPNPPAGGTLTGSGIYSFGEIVTVKATPNSGYQFVSWTEGGTVVSTGTNYAFIINSSRVLVANFALLSVLSVTPDFVNVNHPAGTTSFSVANTGSGTLNWSAVSNTSWITITGAGSGTNSGTINVSYNANTGNARTGTITVTAAGASGSPKIVEVRQATYTDVRDLNDKPETFNLFQNFPNPFNPTTNIRFNLSKDSMVSLKVYNILGQEIAQLINKEMPAGSYQYDFDASQLTSGLYIYKIQTENFVQAKKMLLMK